MAEFKEWLQAENSLELEPGVTFIDADTVATPDGNVRLQGINAPEVAHLTSDGRVTEGEVGGQMSTDQVSKLAKEMGFTHVKITGAAAHGRHEGDLINPKTGESFRARLAQEGLAKIDPRFDTTGLQAQADYGAYLRTKKGRERNSWDEARDLITEAMMEDGKALGHFRIAQSASGDWRVAKEYWESQGLSEAEAEKRANEIYNRSSAALHYKDRDIATGDSHNPFSDAWDTGLIGVQESMWGVVDLLGEQVDSDYLTTHGQIGVQRARNRIADRGRIITDYKDVDGFFDAVEYVGNNALLSLPYMGITAAATLAAPVTGGLSLAAPAAVYTGQTWNEMEGDKSASVAIGAGVAQAALDRLGIGLIFKGAGKAPRDMLQAGIKSSWLMV